MYHGLPHTGYMCLMWLHCTVVFIQWWLPSHLMSLNCTVLLLFQWWSPSEVTGGMNSLFLPHFTRTYAVSLGPCPMPRGKLCACNTCRQFISKANRASDASPASLSVHKVQWPGWEVNGYSLKALHYFK